MGNKITGKLLRQAGFTLMEMIAAMVVMGSVMVGVYSLSEQSLNNTKGSVVALHLRTVGDAANQYIKANTSTIMTYLNGNPTTPYLIRINDLTTGGYLPSGYALKNGEGQAACALVLKQGSNLNALVLTEGGNAIDDLTLGQIAATIGGAGGAVYTSAATTVKGAMGGWSFPIGNFANGNNKNQKCDGTGGAVSVGTGHPMMALWLTEGNADAATLYRDAVVGNESLNTMNTPIIMGSGPAVTKTEGSACGGASDPRGSIARAPDGAVLSCVTGNTWQKSGSMFWRDPVPTFALLPATDLNGSVRMTQDTGRAFMRDSTTPPSGWRALAVDQNGNMTVQNNLTVGGVLGVTGSSTVGGNSTVGGGLSVTGSSTVGGNSTVGGDLSAAAGRVVASRNGNGGYVRLSDPTNTWHADLQYNSGGLEVRNHVGTQVASTDYSGNFSSKGNINSGWDVNATNGVTAGGLARLNGGVQTTTVNASGALSANSANIATNMRSNAVEVTSSLQLNNVATAGAWCPTNGMVARDANGKLLSCVAGTFQYAGLAMVPKIIDNGTPFCAASELGNEALRFDRYTDPPDLYKVVCTRGCVFVGCGYVYKRVF